MNVFTLALKSDKELQKYLEEKDDDYNFEIPSSMPIESNTGKLLAQSYESEEDKNEKGDSGCNAKEVNETQPPKQSEEKETVQRRTIFQKWFSPMEAGSIRGSIFNMVILSLGSGCLSLPKYISKTSLILSSSLIIVVGLFVWRALTLISRACDKERIFIYSHLIKKLYGKPLAILYDVIVILNSLGVLILYNVISKLRT